jgi:hypothetical protein
MRNDSILIERANEIRGFVRQRFGGAEAADVVAALDIARALICHDISAEAEAAIERGIENLPPNLVGEGASSSEAPQSSIEVRFQAP